MGHFKPDFLLKLPPGAIIQLSKLRHFLFLFLCLDSGLQCSVISPVSRKQASTGLEPRGRRTIALLTFPNLFLKRMTSCFH